MAAWLPCCLSSEDRASPPTLVLLPASAYAGEFLAVTLFAPGIDFSKCSTAVESLVFTDPSGGHGVTVYRINRLAYDSTSLRAYLRVSLDAAAETNAVTYRCDGTTELNGEFEVKKVPGKIGLQLNPSALAAGSFGARITVSTDSETFVFTENTQFYFGDGNYIKITEKHIIGDWAAAQEVDLIVNVDALTPLGEMTVSAVEGGNTYEGKLTVTDRVKASLTVEPSRVKRQAADQDLPPVYELRIRGKGIDFVPPDPDAGAEDPNATVIEFPENPGLSLLDDFEVLEDEDENGVFKVLRAQVRVSSSALLGATPLFLRTGAQEAWTDFAVDLPPNTPLLQIVTPKFVTKNGVGVPVYTEAVNFTFDAMKSIQCETDGCSIQNVVLPPKPAKTMTMDVLVNPNVTASFVTVRLEIDTGEGTTESVVATINAKAAEAPVLVVEDASEKPGNSELRQGADNRSVNLVWSDASGTFQSAVPPAVAVPARSGLEVAGVDVVSGNSKCIVVFNVADDAPVGPAYLAVTVNGSPYEVPIKVVPYNTAVPQMALEPVATLRKRESIQVHVNAKGFELPTTRSGYFFDDPGLQIEDVTMNPDNGTLMEALLTVNVSPRARKDMSVLYAETDATPTSKAAATFRTLDYQKTEILRANPESVSREGNAGGNTFILVVRENGIFFDLPVVDVVDDIGLSITRVSAGEDLVFDLQVDLVGPGGYTALNLKNKGRNYAIPLFVEAPGGPAQGLTTQFNPESVVAGSSMVTITARVPTLKLEKEMVEVRADHQRAYASVPTILSDSALTFVLDVAEDAYIYGKFIPVYIITPNGSALGMIEIAQAELTLLSEGTSWTGNLKRNVPVRFLVNELDTQDGSSLKPLYLDVFHEDQGNGSLRVMKTSENGLDVTEVDGGQPMWMTDLRQHTLAVVSDEDVDGVKVSLRSRARGAMNEEVDEKADTDWDLPDKDPCKEPILLRGAIQGALDVDSVFLDKPECFLVAFAAARELSDLRFETPDLKMQYYDAKLESGKPVRDLLSKIGEDSGGVGRDPRLNIKKDLMLTDIFAVSVEAELGSTGDYLLQIRNPFVFREFSIATDAPFIEFEIVEDMRFEECELVLYDTETDSEIERLRLTEVFVDDEEDENMNYIENDAGMKQKGKIVIAGLPMDGADAVHNVALLPTDSSFALMLYYDGELMDAVQLREEPVIRGEGKPIIPVDTRPVFFRVAGIDTNNNAEDFAASSLPRF